MRIKLTDGAEPARLPSWRPPAVAQLTAEAKQAVTVVLSEEMRALNATLTRTLTDTSGLRLHDVLTADDRLLIAWAGEFAKAEGIEPEEVEKLVADLGRYRMQELTGHRAEASVTSVRAASVLGALLALPVYGPREEAQARAIMFSLATTRSSFEPAFVRSLLDPELRPARSVSLTFLQRMVAAMPSAAPEGVGELNAIYARRDGRAAIAKALHELALPVSDLVQPSQERSELGGALLRARARLVTPQSPWQLLSNTTRNDRALLGLLYVSQDERGGGLRAVDDVARALVSLRTVERPQAASTPQAAQSALAKQLPMSTVLTRSSAAPAATSDSSRTFGSAIHLAAKAAVAYRSVAPPRPNTVPPPPAGVGRELTAYGPPPQRGETSSTVAPFNLVQALGLSALVAEMHTQAMRARRRKLKRSKSDSIGDTAAMLDAQPENDRDPTHAARTHARWRRVARRASSRGQ